MISLTFFNIILLEQILVIEDINIIHKPKYCDLNRNTNTNCMFFFIKHALILMILNRFSADPF